KNSTKQTRRPGVYALYGTVAEHLADWYGTTVNVLPMELEKHYGKEMGHHGATTDEKWLSGSTKKLHDHLDKYMADQNKGKFKGEFKDPFLDTLNPVYQDR